VLGFSGDLAAKRDLILMAVAVKKNYNRSEKQAGTTCPFILGESLEF
jgi:hypothetical protein